MANEIQIAASTTIVQITALPGFAINTPEPQVTAIEANAQATSINVFDVSNAVTVSTQTFDFGGLTSTPVTLNVGTQQDPVAVNQAFSNFKYKFPNFVQDTSSFNSGDVVYFESGVNNNYGVEIRKADVTNVEFGAKGALYLFIEHVSTTLVLLHKGFHDYSNTSTQIDTWTAGHTLYLNRQNKIDADVSEFAAGQWVRSIGFCVPNVDSVKRIWFEGDTTFVRLKNANI